MMNDFKKINWKIYGLFLLLLICQLLTLVYFGGRKAGFHEDELYSYYSTNKTAGLFVNDRQWTDTESIRNDFVVLKGEQFRYNVVKQMQSWDVHPPVYYYILHTVCSLFPGVFSKWLGILVNLIAYIPCFFLLMLIGKECVEAETAGEGETDGKRGLSWYVPTFLVCLFWGFSAAVISGVMFIRMYQWLTLFILLCAYLHIRALKRNYFGWKFLLSLGITVFLGFLTQYFYIIFHVFIGVCFCFLLLQKKRWKEILLYGFSCGMGLLLAILYYPSSLRHIFRGYRGTEAVSEFTNGGNTLDRLYFFYQLFDEYVAGGVLAGILLIICLLLLTTRFMKKKNHSRMMGMLFITCAGYFFTVSKTALLLGETSNRYMLPIYGLFIWLLLYYLIRPLKTLLPENCWKWGALVLFLGIALIDGSSLVKGKIFFLYEEEKTVMEYVKENKATPVVVFYNDASPDNVWRLSDELMEYPEIYLASQGNAEPIEDTRLLESEKIIAYVADYETKDCLDSLVSADPKLTGYKEVAKKGLWTIYELD